MKKIVRIIGAIMLLLGAAQVYGGTRVYVGNLPPEMTENDLQSLFAQHGTVSGVRIIKDRETGRSRGFAFVEMADDAAAKNAIEALDGQELGGRALRVHEAQKREGRNQGRAGDADGRRRRDGRGGGRGDRAADQQIY